MKAMTLAALVSTLAGVATFPAAPARADAVYTYTGNPFSSSNSPYTGSDYVSGSFTLPAPLAANLNNATLSPLSFTFSDGAQTLTNTSPNINSEFYSFSTNSSGAISSWYVYIDDTSTSPANEIATTTSEDWVSYQGNTAQVFNTGSWAVTVPEPGSVFLFGSGLLALVFLGRRQRTLRQTR